MPPTHPFTHPITPTLWMPPYLHQTYTPSALIPHAASLKLLKMGFLGLASDYHGDALASRLRTILPNSICAISNSHIQLF